MKSLRHLTMLAQLGFSIATPLVLCILGSRWLQNRFSLGGWILAVGVLLGVGGAFSGLVKCMKRFKSEIDRDEEKPPVSFNDHE